VREKKEGCVLLLAEKEFVRKKNRGRRRRRKEDREFESVLHRGSQASSISSF